jgi:hypothetical protein
MSSAMMVIALAYLCVCVCVCVCVCIFLNLLLQWGNCFCVHGFWEKNQIKICNVPMVILLLVYVCVFFPT